MTHKTTTVFRVVMGPPYTRCACGVELAGVKCWRWYERDGTEHHGCRNCLFRNAQIEVAS